jgi:nicotinate-nucleotide pyrophosphorylase (carboxylating)
MGERVALNLTQRMSGVATLTRAFVDQLPAECPTRIVDTRKTTPGLRGLERYAVRVGGGHNHRDNLSSAVLIKDNHIVAAGGIENAVKGARQRAPHTSRIEVEVANLAEFDTALALGCEIIMIDNFSHVDMLEAAKRGRGKAILEVSGGVKLDRVRALASAGVDVISAGALTHSAPAADIALDMELVL